MRHDQPRYRRHTRMAFRASSEALETRLLLASGGLLQEADFVYQGSFRLPSGTYGNSTFEYGGDALAFNENNPNDPNDDTLFISGHAWQETAVAEVSIPNVVNSTNLGSLSTASVVQPFADITDGLNSQVHSGNGTLLGGLLVDGNQLVWSVYDYYDGAAEATFSHGTSPLNLSGGNDAQGMFRVGDSLNPGYYAGYMAHVPQAWQTDFGMRMVTGQANLNIISRTSAGPALFGFDPDDFGSTPAPDTPFVYYDVGFPLANMESQNPFFNFNSHVNGIVFAEDSNSVIFFGGHGTGDVCYGDPEPCNDPDRGGKGWHDVGGNYIYQAWAYDVADFLAVKNGQLQPWEVQPYDVWEIDLPFASGDRRLGGVGYDPHTNRVYVSQQYGDGASPVIHVYELQSTPDTTAPFISNVAVTNITDTSATITWTTDEPADSLVEYWQTSTPGNVLTAQATSSVTSHSIPLNGLQAETSYGYRVISKDPSGNETTSNDFLFVTSEQQQSSTTGGWNWDNPEPLPAIPAGAVQVSNVSELVSAVANLQSNQTISIQPGTYNLSDALYVPQGISNWAIRGATGDRDDVVIQGNGMNGSVSFGFWISTSPNGTLADLTIQNIREHGVIANPGAHDMLYHNLRMVDVGDQFIKSNPNGYGNGNDNGTVAYSVFEYTTDEQGAGSTANYTNGVDVHGGDGWTIHHNLFRNILHQPGGGLAGPAILMWNGSNNTVVDGNTFINVARGIAMGLYDNPSGTDHSGGIVRNNFFYRDAGLASDADVPVSVADSPNTKVYHNTLISQGTYPNAIEYRFGSTTGTDIRNNLSDGAIVARDGATGTQAGNVDNALMSMFANPSAGDLHLVPSASVIDQAIALPDVTNDIDGQSRDANPDVGADEFVTVTDPVLDDIVGFNSGEEFWVGESNGSYARLRSTMATGHRHPLIKSSALAT